MHDVRYYLTLTAARLAGMGDGEAIRLAYLCQGVAELKEGSPWLAPWFSEGHLLTPFSTSLPVNLNVEHRTQGQAISARWLAFHYLPSELQSASRRSGIGNLNPLKDVDWRAGAFHRRCGSGGASQTEQALTCLANSGLSQYMISDTIRHKQALRQLALPLFAVRLYAYQSGWLYQGLFPTQAAALENERLYRRADVLELFLWTWSAIRCYVQGNELTAHAASEHALLEELEQVATILNCQGDVWVREAAWLQFLAQRFETAAWSLMYTPNSMLVDALSRAEVSWGRQILHLNGFKSSDYFLLCKACEWQSQWLAKGLSQSPLANRFQCAAQLGDKAYWALD